MKFVPAPQMTGQRWNCAVTGRSADDEGMFDSHRILAGWDQPVHISAAAVKEMATKLGWVSPDDIEELVVKAREMGAEIESLRELLAKVEQMQALEAEVAEAVAA